MKRKILVLAGAALAACAFFAASTYGASEGDKVISDFMKKYHKAPKGTDPVCKKAGAGTATDAELAELLKGYEAIGAVKPPRGDEADWKKKTDALVAAVKELQAKDPGGLAAYKAAVSCKACHDLHKPQKAK